MIAVHIQEIAMEDFEIQPMNPMQQLQEIVELAHQCVAMKKAYVNVQLFGVNTDLRVTIIPDFDIEEYETLNTHCIIPTKDSWDKYPTEFVKFEDQIELDSIINRLREVLA